MPNATVDINATERVDLKTCDGGFVVLRRLPYGQWLKRQDMSMKMKMEMRKGDTEGDLDISILNRAVTEFEFKECIVEHNLEDANAQSLDFRKGYVLDQLNPKIGQEISDNIARLHQFEEELGN